MFPPLKKLGNKFTNIYSNQADRYEVPDFRNKQDTTTDMYEGKYLKTKSDSR